MKDIAENLAFDRFTIARFDNTLTYSFYKLDANSRYLGGGKISPTYGPRNKTSFINSNHRHLTDVQRDFLMGVSGLIEPTGYLVGDARFGLLKLEHTRLRVANMLTVWHLHAPTVWVLFSDPDSELSLIEGTFDWYETRNGKKLLRTDYLDNPYSMAALDRTTRERAAKMATAEERRKAVHELHIAREENTANSIRSKINRVYGGVE